MLSVQHKNGSRTGALAEVDAFPQNGPRFDSLRSTGTNSYERIGAHETGASVSYLFEDDSSYLFLNLNIESYARYRFLKRVTDISIASVFLLLVASWLFPIIALSIKLTSRGPIFFRQKRYGKDGIPFVCLKFRTMMHDQGNAFFQATKDDCRVTRAGRFLRRTSLDELPQFINALWGDMAVIGPRPHAIDHDDKFRSLVPNFGLRYMVKPGITGLAQMLGHRGETRSLREMAQRVRLDLVYIRKISLALDAKIFVGTLYSLVRGDPNAY